VPDLEAVEASDTRAQQIPCGSNLRSNTNMEKPKWRAVAALLGVPAGPENVVSQCCKISSHNSSKLAAKEKI
jgi:hypothetical protein